MNIKGDQIAIGRYARAEKGVHMASEALLNKNLSDIANKLDNLLQTLNQHVDQLNDAGDVMGATEQIARELARDKPNKLTLKGILDDIIESAKSIASVVNAADALKAAIFALL